MNTNLPDEMLGADPLQLPPESSSSSAAGDIPGAAETADNGTSADSSSTTGSSSERRHRIPATALDLLAAATFHVQANARAQSTQDCYASAWRDWTAWCDLHSLPSFPASPPHVALYLTDLVKGRGRAIATVEQRLAAIRHAHISQHHPSPTTTPLVRDTLRGLKRECAGEVRRRDAITLALLDDLLQPIDLTTPQGVRDAALLAVGFYGGCRRSELAGFEMRDLQADDQGITLLLRKSKTDQFGQGHIKAFPLRTDRPSCPVTALRGWLALRGNGPGPLFCTVRKGGTITGKPLSGRDVGSIVLKRVKAAGISPDRLLTAHSLRIGFVTEARRRGARNPEIMAQTNHRDERMIAIYTRRLDAWQENAVSRL